ncbi:hypothetical protein H4Q32_006105 [Labeo rohita]|uniref:Uncharacterized protein n=1 Tax=Labeo rohita TaxID=84645 RepID=A0ABQ8LQ76_LABRO|nr:hypothetical protein H4Q32_006105 [Labeo rohita]
MSIRPCDKTSKTKPQRFWDALGPFPRSVWIHPCTPEDSLDRACGNILKRYVLASKGVWPHLPENAHVFADEDGDIQSYTSRGHDGSLSTQSVGHQKLDKVMLMIQHNMTQTLLPGHVDATCPCFPDDRCSHGHEPDKTIEIEADGKNTGEFLKEIVPKNATRKADIPEGPSDEDFPPLPPPASPQVDRPPQQAPVSKSGSYKATVLKGQPNLQLHGGKPQRAQKRNQKEHPRVSAKTTPKIEAQTTQGFIDQPSFPQTGSAPKEKVTLVEQNSLPRCSHLPVFAEFQKADEQIIPKEHTLKGGDVELGRSADGAHMAETRAGSGTGSVQNAAGPLDNAKCHIYHKDSAVAKTKATEMSMPEDMDGIQIWNSSGRCPLQNAQFFTGTGHGPWSLPANCFLWFPVTEGRLVAQRCLNEFVYD